MRLPSHTFAVLKLLPVLSFFALFFFQQSFTVCAQDDDEVERVEADLVVLNVTVTDAGGAFVHKLGRRDFKVFEDGVEQRVNVFAAEENPFAAAILLDTSGSMETRITLARAAAIRFLDRLRADDVAAIYHFGSKVERLQDFVGGRDLPPTAYDLSAKGQTRLHDAVAEAARDLSKRPETRRAILILSDGIDTASDASLDKSLNLALSANVTVYAVNMTDTNLPMQQRQMLAASLKKMAEKSGGRYVASPGGRALDEAFEGLVEELRNQYTLGYRPTNRERNGKWRAITIELSNKDYRTRAKTGYKAPKS